MSPSKTGDAREASLRWAKKKLRSNERRDGG
jgi:hypothetical protein